MYIYINRIIYENTVDGTHNIIDIFLYNLLFFPQHIDNLILFR